MDELKAPGKPFAISKRAVRVAWEKVKANGGAAGVDGVSIGVHSGVGHELWFQAAEAGSHGSPARARVTASSAVSPWFAAESR